MKLVRGVPLLLERHVHVRGYVSVPLYKHKTNSMVQTIATLIDETLMVMGAHLHVRMTDEEKAYLDAHFELIHIKKGEHLVTRGEEVCYLYYLESASSGYGFRTKRIERFQHGLSKPKSSSIFSFHMKNTMPTTISRHWSHARSGDCPKKIFISYMSYPSISTSWPEYIW